MKRILFSTVCVSLALLLASCTDRDVSDKNVQLLQAAKDGSIKNVQALLAEGANPNTTDDYGATVLMWAANNDHTEVIKLLLDKGAEVNAKATINNVEWTALKVTKRMGHTDIVQMLEKAMVKE